MEERHVTQLIQNLIDRFEYIGEDQFNLDNELSFLHDPVTRNPLDGDVIDRIERGFLERIRYRRSHDGAIITPVSVVSDPREHEEWYDGWMEEHNNVLDSYYWKRLENFLSNELTRKYGPERAGAVVRSIDEATFSIMFKLANPERLEFNYKGLVVGYVQSGKTANFTALIAKAADAGYKFIIVLGGIHNVLRRQTQIRLDKELTGMNDLGIEEVFIAEPSDIKRWNRLTTARNRLSRSRNGQIKVKDIGEFDTINVDPFDSLCNRATPTIAIVKKNVTVLDKLIDYISDSSEQNRDKLPVLIIDDEADQASIDIYANDPDSDASGTNDCIRQILSLFNRKAYVGYTATPFANVLIDKNVDDDLYPRNFVISLPEPEGYFGASKIFQGNLSERFVREIPDESAQLLMHGEMTENLANAIDQFILCCAVRNIRGNRRQPMSMLVHVTHRINEMGIINDIISRYVEDIAGRYRSRAHTNALKAHLESIWDSFYPDSEAINEDLELNNIVPDFETIWSEIGNVFDILSILELNSASEDLLDYTTGEEVKVIAIGGNQLSRGLTLEGLMTSYYLRASRQYDTLLQMARWFGYRQGYEDLTRVYTTSQIWDFFEHLALVEQELRSEIYRYEEENRTPAQMAVAIRAHRNLTVTARNKMGASGLRQISYSDSLNQTIWFPLDRPDVLRANYNLGESFIRRINSEYGFTEVGDSGVYLANRKIDGEVILRDFLTRYTFVDRESTGGPGLDYDSLFTYITRRMEDINPELREWSLTIVGNANPASGNDPIDYGGLSINRIHRSRKHTEMGYNIGVLTEPDHMTIDLTPNSIRSSHNPMLLLYLIDKDSEARVQVSDQELRTNQRIDLFRFVNTQKVDVLGLAILLPKSNYEPNSYIGQ